MPGQEFWITDLFPGLDPSLFTAASYNNRIEVYNITIDGNPTDINTEVTIQSIISKDNFTTEVVLAEITLKLQRYVVTFTVKMQERTSIQNLNDKVPFILTSVTDPGLTYQVQSINATSNNVVFTGVKAGTYRITTLQSRYLNITDDNNVTVTITNAGYVSANVLWLLSGNAIWTNNRVDINDAGKIGTDWGKGIEGSDGIDTDADVNFDKVVGIGDLALVGLNYYKTSSTYSDTNSLDYWQP